MSLWKIAWRSLQQRSLSSVLTCLSMTLGVALVVTVLLVYSVVNDTFSRNASLGYHLVVGGKNGSKLDLVLSSVYHIRAADEPLPWSYYKEFITSKGPDGKPAPGRFAGSVARAVPICMGDTLAHFRVIGTTPEYFEFEYTNDTTYSFRQGRCFDSAHYFEAVIGADVARELKLTVGSTFKPTHGVSEGEDAHVHDDDFTIVGILAQTGTPNDRGVFVNIEGFYLLDNHAKPVSSESASHAQDLRRPPAPVAAPSAREFTRVANSQGHLLAQTGKPKPPEKHDHAGHDHHGHDHHGHDHGHGHGHGHAHHHEPLPENQREVSAVLVLCGGLVSDASALSLLQKINEGNEAQAAQPVLEIRQLLSIFVDPLRWLLLALSMLTVLVASIGVMVSIYNSMTGRRHEIAVMRALGAGRGTVMMVVLLESILLSLAAGIAGLVLGHAILALGQPFLVQYTGVNVGLFHFDRLELIVIPALVVLASIVGYVPALSAYRTDVARALHP